LLYLFLTTALAVAAPEGESGEAAFVNKHRCVISQVLNLVRDAPSPPGTEQNRYVILYPTGTTDQYAQCAYDGPRAAYCEVASPFYQPKGAKAARLPALARLGYDLDATKGNYVKQFKLDAEEAPPLADFLLRSLYAAFLDSPAVRLSFKAPLVKASPSPNACLPTS